jgi:hypothetical protein
MMAMFLRILCCSLMAMGLLAQEHPAPANPDGGARFQISGVLVNSITGQPVRNARVVMSPVTNREAYSLVITGEDGHFLFRNLTPGKYGLRAQRRGYLTRSFDQHEQWSTAIAVGPGLESNDLIFRLPPECAISGRISDEAGEPVTNGQVFLYQAGSPGLHAGIHLWRQAEISEEGFYHFGHLPPGKYFVLVSSTPWYAQRPESQQTTFQTFGTSSGGVMMGVYSPQQGRSPLDVAYPMTFYPGVTEANAATPIVLKEADKFEADMSLQPVPAITLHVPASVKSTADNTKADFLRLTGIGFDAAPISIPEQTRVLESGDLEITGVAPGSYRAEILDDHSDTRAVMKTAEIDAANSGDINLEHQVASVSISAEVQLENGTAVPLDGFLQLANTNGGEVFREQVSSPGEIQFTNTLKPGTYEVSFLNTRGEFIKTISAEGGTISGRVLEIKGGPLKLNVTVAHGEGSVTGVALRDSKPVGGVMIILVPADVAHNLAIVRRDQSDSDGTFNLPSIVPGKYTLLAIENRWDLEWLNPDALKPYLSKGQVVEVQQDGKYSVTAKVQ